MKYMTSKLNKITNAALLASVLLLGGCGEIIDGMFEDTTEDTEQEFSFDLIKQISSERKDLSSDATFEEDAYRVGPKARLLMSLSQLQEHVSEIRIDEKRRAWVQISLTDETRRDAALSGLKICPLNRTWMYLSNWNYAHPYGRKGRWSTDGGDFIESMCVSPQKDISSTNLSTDLNKIYFDVSDWVKNYVIGRNKHYGLILISSEELSIEGDLSPQDSPRLKWIETK